MKDYLKNTLLFLPRILIGYYTPKYQKILKEKRELEKEITNLSNKKRSLDSEVTKNNTRISYFNSLLN